MSEQQPEQQKPKKKSSTKDGLIGLGVIAVIIIVVVAIFSGGKTPGTKNTANNSQNKVPAIDYQVADWENAHNSIFTTLGNDMGAFSRDAQALNYSAITADCQKIQDDAQTAQSYPAIPSASIEQYWSDMLSNLSSGGQDCVSGVNNTDANQITQANTEFTKASTDLSTISGALELAKTEVNSH